MIATAAVSGKRGICMDSGLPVDVRRLALLPVRYLVQQDEQFDQLCPEAGRIDESYRDVFVAGFWAYPLYAYLDLVGSRFGMDMRQAVRRQFLVFFDELAGAGTAVDDTLDLIDIALTAGDQRLPATITKIGGDNDMKAALALLLGLPQSPDYESDPERRQHSFTSKPEDVDWQLSHCLSRCRRTMHDTFSTLLDYLELDLLIFGEHTPAMGNSSPH